jgi:ABC-2 type transport system permease protein
MRALTIVRRDLIRYLRNPGRTALLFAMPLVMAGIFSLVFGGNGGAEGISIRVLLFDQDQSLLSRLLAGAGGSSQADGRLDIVPVGAEGLEMMERGEASALVHLPEGFTADFLAGRQTTIEVIKNPAHRFLPQVVDEGVGILGVVLSQASVVFRSEFNQISQFRASNAFPEDAAVAAMSGDINGKLRELDHFLFPPVISLETTTSDAGDSGAGFSILAIMLPGLSVMGILFLAQSATRDILRDRESGLLRHLLTSPVSVGDYILGKSLSVLLVTTVGFLILVLIGVAAGVHWGSPPAVAALLLATSVAASGTLLLIMSAVGSERQGDALTTIIIISWSLLGGGFVPVSQIPAFLRPISATTLVYWATDGFNALVINHAGVTDIALNLVVLTGFGFTFLMAGALLLQRRIGRGV